MTHVRLAHQQLPYELPSFLECAWLILLFDVLNLPYFYGSISNDILDGAIFNRIFFPGGNIKKRRSMARNFPKDELPIVQPWGQRRLKRSTQTNADINRSQQEDEIMRGKICLI